MEAAEREERNHRRHGASKQQTESREERRLVVAEVPRRREKYNSHRLGFQVGLYVIRNGYMGYVYSIGPKNKQTEI